MTKSRAQQRIDWRDSLLSKYEQKIERLKLLLQYASCYVVHLPQTEELRKEIQQELDSLGVFTPSKEISNDKD